MPHRWLPLHPCHAERSSEDRGAILTAKSKHPYPPRRHTRTQPKEDDTNYQIPSAAIFQLEWLAVQKNCLYYGDNLTVLREHIKDESVDLIYLDPPFNSRQDYNVLFAEKDGTRSSSQIMAFEDTWEWNMDAEAAYEEIVERGGASPTPCAPSAPSSATAT